jgi:hypothetical protein
MHRDARLPSIAIPLRTPASRGAAFVLFAACPKVCKQLTIVCVSRNGGEILHHDRQN